MGIGVQQSLRGQNHRRRAIAALRGAELGKGDLQRVRPAAFGNAFDGGDLMAHQVQRQRQADFVVMAFTPGRGDHPLQALVVGSYDGIGFRPAGRVSGGYDLRAALRMRRLLDPLPSASANEGERWAGDDLCWVEPQIVVSVKFSEWDRTGQLRFPIYCGLKTDVSPNECVRLPLVEAVVPVRPRVQIELPSLPL